jgi:hypothetical protein
MEKQRTSKIIASLYGTMNNYGKPWWRGGRPTEHVTSWGNGIFPLRAFVA